VRVVTAPTDASHLPNDRGRRAEHPTPAAPRSAESPDASEDAAAHGRGGTLLGHAPATPVAFPRRSFRRGISESARTRSSSLPTNTRFTAAAYRS
jgi:hypothetical protein